MHSDDTIRAALDPVSDDWDPRQGFRRAAVLAPLWEVDGHDQLLLTKRPDAMKDHAGQVAFPGGRREAGETPIQCALRESEEEVGIGADDVVSILGALPPRISNAGYLVHTVVARIRTEFVPRPDPREVERVLVAPLRELIEHERWVWRVPEGARNSYPFFDFDERATLWGLTGRLAWDLLERLGHRAPERG